MIVVTTCDRSEYLQQTLDAIDLSATGRKVLVADRCEPPARAGWEVSHVPPRPSFARPRENKWCLWHAFDLAAAAGEDLLFFQDDLALCRNAVRYVQRLAVPDDVALVSLFAPFGDSTMPHGLWRSKCHVYMYCQAVKFPLRTVRELAAARQEMADQLNRGGDDDALQVLGSARGWLYAVHYPSIVQHVGAKSSVSDATLVGCRVSRAFPGVDFDAETLHHSMFR
jgi:hypothetical protein